MAWQPRIALVTAERVVDYPKINSHIDERRETLERALKRPMMDLADSLVFFAVPSLAAAEAVQQRLYRGLATTYLFGFREARKEIAKLRQGKTVLIADLPPHRESDISRYLGTFVVTVLHGMIDALIKYRSEFAEDDPLLQAKMRDKASRLSHNAILEVVGQVLNAGRTFAAIGQDEPIIASRSPAKWAMRSEQLDQNTCVPCEGFHGETVQVGSLDYFDLMPPTGCLGQGRCRGIYVYADDPADFLTL